MGGGGGGLERIFEWNAAPVFRKSQRPPAMTPAPREKIGGGGGFPRADFLVGRRSSDHAGPAGTPTMRDTTAAAGEKVKAADIDRRAIRYRNKVDTGRHRRLGFS